jgi:hypothetical protein
MADERDPEKFLLGDIVELNTGEGEADERDIRPVLVFGENNGGPGSGQVVSSAHFKAVQHFAPAGNHHFHEAVERGSRGGAGRDKMSCHLFGSLLLTLMLKPFMYACQGNV